MARKNGDGSFRKLPNGSIEFTVSIGFDEYGANQRKRFYGKTETECRKKHKEFMKGDAATHQSKRRERTLSGWIDEWLPAYKEGNVQSSTYKDYVNLAKHIKAHKIGKMKLSAIKPIHVTTFFKDTIEYSKSFRGQMRFLLNGAFESAIDNDYITKNPVRRAEIARSRNPRKTASQKMKRELS